MTPQRTDWIGLFTEDFTSLDQYVGFVWVETQQTERRFRDAEPQVSLAFAVMYGGIQDS